MNILNIYKNTINKKCPLCKKDVTMEHIKYNNFIYTKTKKQSNLFTHKTCLVMKGVL